MFGRSRLPRWFRRWMDRPEKEDKSAWSFTETMKSMFGVEEVKLSIKDGYVRYLDSRGRKWRGPEEEAPDFVQAAIEKNKKSMKKIDDEMADLNKRMDQMDKDLDAAFEEEE